MRSECKPRTTEQGHFDKGEIPVVYVISTTWVSYEESKMQVSTMIMDFRSIWRLWNLSYIGKVGHL